MVTSHWVLSGVDYTVEVVVAAVVTYSCRQVVWGW